MRYEHSIFDALAVLREHHPLVRMMALKWMDKRPVCMLTTIHDDATTTQIRRTRRVEGDQEEIKKPAVVEGYNKFMGDQINFYPTTGFRIVRSNGGEGQNSICLIWLW